MTSLFDAYFNKDRENRKPGKIQYKNDVPEDMDPIKFKANIYGRVQGVGFRFSTKHLADELGVSGIVRNESDGSVYVEAVGDKEAIEQFITELAKGPSPSADVTKIIIEYDFSITDYQGFGERH
jgi:acylphosphatase